MNAAHEFRTEHDHVEPLLAEHALGSVDEPERARIDAHLAECAACRTTLAELADGVTELEVAVLDPSVLPRAGAREALLVRAAGTPQLTGHAADAAPQPRSTRTERHRRVRQWVLVAAPTLACVALLATAWNQAGRIDTLEQRLDDARGDQVPVLKGASIDDLDIGGPFGDTDAQVVLKRDAGIITFRDVPAPPPDMAWQVSAVDGDERIHAIGTITGARELAIVALAGVDPDEIERIIVTTEPLDDTAPAPLVEDVAAEATI